MFNPSFWNVKKVARCELSQQTEKTHPTPNEKVTKPKDDAAT